MRLTLRTLLASLDRVLPPAEQHELDAKVAGSAAAQQLAVRIRRVVEQPGIPAPRLDGRGLAADANSVAEYLDNCLDPERLETFERICLESDMHLAEVAACHEMLAGVARDPATTAPLDAAGRRKLLAALGHRSSEPGEESARREAVENARAVHAALGEAAARRERSEAGGRRAAWPAWAAALTAVALLVALGVFLVQAVGRSRTRPADARREPAVAHAPTPEPAAVEPAAVQPPPAEPLPPHAAPADAVAAVPAESAAEPPAAPPVAMIAAAPAAESPAPAAEVPPAASPPVGPPPAAAPAATPRVPQGDALAIAAPEPAAPGLPAPALPAPVAAPPTAPVAGPESLGFVDAEGLLIHRVPAEGKPTWQAVAPGSPLAAREDLVAPFGSQPDIHVRGLTIRLLPGTRVVVSAEADGSPRLEVVFGRAIVRASRSDARVGIAAAGLVGTVTAGLTGPVAVSVDLDRPPGSDPAHDPARVRASVIAVNGGIVWRQGGAGGQGVLEGIAAEGMLDARTAITWESASPGAGRAARLDPLPTWVAAPPQPDRLQRSAGEAIAARLADGGPLEQALRELAGDRRVENRLLAAATLSLLGDFDAAVELLCDEAPGRRLEQRQWTKLEADVVPLALARGANAAARLRQAFEDRGPHGKAETLFAMARGFSDDELAAGAAETLVEALDDADLVVRRYAFKCLCDIVQPTAADRLKYRPDGLPDLRREGAAWWRGQLQKGLIRRPGAA